MSAKPQITILLGATASGKSALAERFFGRCKLLSADSLAVFKELEIISARPRGDYYGVGICSIFDDFCVGDFLREFERAAAEAARARQPLLIVGGTSFYIAALFNGLSPAVPRLAQHPSNEKIAQIMRQIDPNAKICANDSHRLQRWWEIFAHTGEAPSKWMANNLQPPLLKREQIGVYELVRAREQLLRRIEIRSEQMLQTGALSECAKALAALIGGGVGGDFTGDFAGDFASAAGGVGGDFAGDFASAAGGISQALQAVQNAAAQAFASNKALKSIGAKQICERLINALASAEFAGEFGQKLTQAPGGQRVVTGNFSSFGEKAPDGEAAVTGNFSSQTGAEFAACALEFAAQFCARDALLMRALGEEICLRTRQFAKRQRTFNRSLGACELAISEHDEAADLAAAEAVIAHALGLCSE